MNDPLHRLWPLLDAPEPTVAAHIVKTWLPDVHERLAELGFLLQAEDADLVLCPECHGHIEEVIAGDGPDGTPRFFVPCPEVHRAHVPPEARCRWSVNVAILVESLAAALGLTGRCSELSPGRLWRLGRTAWQGRLRDVMFARGLHWEDARAVHRAILRRSKLIIFVAQTRPPDDFWRGRIPAILALSQVATLGEKGIEMDALEIVAAIKDTEAQAATSDATVVSVEQLKLTIRQQVKAESKTTLTDDILIAAYRQHASLREAAAFLSEQTGKDVSKDKVHRAVKRAGGVQTVRNVKDSDSIKRTVASQRRDRLRKFASPM